MSGRNFVIGESVNRTPNKDVVDYPQPGFVVATPVLFLD